MPADLFESPKLKIERAKHHIAAYRAVFATLKDLDLIETVLENDRDHVRLLHKVRLTKPLPADLALTAADALYNLRAALDQAACSCAISAGNEPSGTYFPHGKDEASFEHSLKKKGRKLPSKVQDTLRLIAPYRGARGYLLRVLHELNLVDKHTRLIHARPWLRNLNLGVGGLTGNLQPIDGAWNVEKQELVFAESGPILFDEHVKVTLAVTFAEIESVKGESVTKVLNEICDAVSSTIQALENTIA